MAKVKYSRKSSSPCIDVTSFDESFRDECGFESLHSGSLKVEHFPKPTHYQSDSELSDRYFTASSGDEMFEASDEDDDDEMCINLDLDDTASLSEFHINLKTLQAVSSMLAHYNPIVQSDKYGNPVFVAPPPPDEEYKELESEFHSSSFSDAKISSTSESECKNLSESEEEEEEDYVPTIEQLDDETLQKNTGGLFSDALSELTDVMEKMAANFVSPTKQPTD